jgi:hypothetical protein
MKKHYNKVCKKLRETYLALEKVGFKKPFWLSDNHEPLDFGHVKFELYSEESMIECGSYPAEYAFIFTFMAVHKITLTTKDPALYPLLISTNLSKKIKLPKDVTIDYLAEKYPKLDVDSCLDSGEIKRKIKVNIFLKKFDWSDKDDGEEKRRE